MKRLIYFFPILLAFGLLACTDGTQSDNSVDSTSPLDQVDAVADGQEEPATMDGEVVDLPPEQMGQLVEKYLDLKNALVQSDPALASTAAEELAKATGGRRDAVLDNLREAATRTSNTEDLAKQREYFERVSGKMYILVKADSDHPTLYRQYCPMAFDNQGAYWLAAEEEINNPYFGDKMLRCGSVEEEL
jgi:hypothetical protein